MKNLLWVGAILLCAVACKEEKPPQPAVQNVQCRITSPTQGEQVAAGTRMTLRGEATVDAGSIRAVALTVGGLPVAAVSTVPFAYEYAIPMDQPAGELAVELRVEGDRDGMATDAVRVVVVEAERQRITCAITSPADGAEVELNGPMTVRGEATADRGGISGVELLIGGRPVSEVTEVPFTYTYGFSADQLPGQLRIELCVKGDQGGEATDAVEVTLRRAGQHPDRDQLVDSRDNAVYRTVRIGGQVWMAENLRYLPRVNRADESSRNEGSEGQPFYYVFGYDGNDVAAAKATPEFKSYGVLYNWFAAMDSADAAGGDQAAVPSGIRGVCPEGWHLPSRAEWEVLEHYVAERLPSVPGDGWYNELDGVWVYDEDCRNVWSALAGMEGWGNSDMSQENPDLAYGPRDTYGFGARPSGDFYPNGVGLEQQFTLSRTAVSYWTTHRQSYGGGMVTLSNLDYRPVHSRYGNQPERGQSVRCLKDETL